jgi:hypothetical protein
VLRIEIDGRWEVRDFVAFYESVHVLYSALAVTFIEQQGDYELERLYRELFELYPSGRKLPRRFRFFLMAQRGLSGATALVPPEKFRDADELLEPHERLIVRRCQYASPGLTDLAGIGQVLGHVKDVVLRCIELCVNRRERQLKNDLLEQERDSKALQNVADRIKILKSLGYSDSHCRQVLAEVSPAVAKLESLVERGMITNAESIENDG